MADHGLLVTFGDHIDAGLSQRIGRLTAALAADPLPGVVDLIPSYTTLLVLLAPGAADMDVISDRIGAAWAAAREGAAQQASLREVTIPVRYGGEDGPDLLDVARATGLSPQEVIARHAAAVYEVGAVGFAPGFAFLIGLPPELVTPRRATPRTVVPAGSIGIGGQQTGIYSLPTPGGWSLIGRTGLALFAPERDQPSLLAVGDVVRFEADSTPALTGTPRRTAPRRMASGRDAIEVLRPGLQDTVQDLGRPGQGRLGVAPGGAVDAGALRLGNRLLGNPEGAAGLEMTVTGPRLRFLRPGRIALTGADLGARLNGLPVPCGTVRVIGPGDELAFGEPRGTGARAYLCLAGGIDVPEVLGSRGTDLTAGFGGHLGRPLRAGDRLRAGSLPRTRPQQRLSPVPAATGAPFRVMRGPQADRFDEAAWRAFLEGRFTVSPQSNRMGVRLEGPVLPPRGGADIISEGMVTGAIQVTGEGQPIVMLPARATIGGYPRIAIVIAADLDRLGQLRSGDTVRFTEVPFPPRA